MKKTMSFIVACFGVCVLGTGCATDSDRRPASTSRAGRPYKEAKPMNHRSNSTETLYQACLRERTEASCRNRLGR
jgi:hypothetical protein